MFSVSKCRSANVSEYTCILQMCQLDCKQTFLHISHRRCILQSRCVKMQMCQNADVSCSNMQMYAANISHPKRSCVFVPADVSCKCVQAQTSLHICHCRCILQMCQVAGLSVQMCSFPWRQIMTEYSFVSTL